MRRDPPALRVVRIGALVCLLGLLASPAAAISPDKPLIQLLHDVWSTDQGLPQSAVQAVLQTSDGYLWVGTQAGLARFDGARFEVFDRYNTEEMARETVADLAEGPDGVLWVALQGGGVLRSGDGGFEAITTEDGLSSDIVWGVEIDGSGTPWFGTQAGLDRLVDGRIEPVTGSDGAPLGQTDELLAASDGTLWIAPEGRGLFRLADGALEQVARQEELPGPHVESLGEALDGSIVVGTSRGPVCVRDGGLEPLPAEGLPVGLAVTAVYTDPHGLLWLGTRSDGLFRVRDGTAERFGVSEGLGAEHVVSIQEDAEGSFWIGTLGGGLNRLRDAPVSNTPNELTWTLMEDRQGRFWVGGTAGLQLLYEGRFIDYPGRDQLAGLEIGALLEARDGSLWIGTLGLGLRVLREGEVVRSLSVRDGLPHDRVFALAEGPDGAIWAGTGRGAARIDGEGLTVLGSESGIPDASIRALLFDREDTLWACSDGGGCATWDGERFRTPPGWPEQAGARAFVIGLHEDAGGSLWMASDGGVLRYRDGRLDVFSREQGMAEDTSYWILEDDDGHLWSSGDRGIFRVSKAALEEVAAGRLDRVDGTLYGRAQGMRWVECNGGSQPAGWKTRDGKLHFPTIGGLVTIDPSWLRSNPVPPPVFVERLRVDGDPVDMHARSVFPPGRRRFEFDYTALTFVGPEQARFRVKLEGLDEDWVEKGSQRQVSYHPLPAGRYTLRVVAANSDGVWNSEGASYAFELRPHLWERPGYRILALVGLALLLGAFPLVRIRQLKAREEELSAAVEERTQELRELALRDPLTGLRNRRFLWEVIPTATEEPRRNESHERRGAESDRVTGFLMVDIDHFKAVNDRHGHAAGDAVLQGLSQLLQESVRNDDIVVRWGGEEFLLVLRRTRADALARFADRLRRRVGELRFELADGTSLRRTCSIGVCTYPFYGLGDDLNVEQVIALADAALYRAKESGRDRIIQVVPGQQPQDGSDLAILRVDLESATVAGLVRLVTAE